MQNPENPVYKLVKMSPGRNIRDGTWRVRIDNQAYRALCQRSGDIWLWYWVGKTSEYKHRFG